MQYVLDFMPGEAHHLLHGLDEDAYRDVYVFLTTENLPVFGVETKVGMRYSGAVRGFSCIHSIFH